jgi:hypothetical protein
MFHTLYSLRTGLDASRKTKLSRMLRGLVLASFRETKPSRRERFLLPNLPDGFGADLVKDPILAGDIRVTRLGAQ